MQLFWRLDHIPELQHLKPGERKTLLQRHIGCWTRIIFGGRMVLCGLVLAMLAGWWAGVILRNAALVVALPIVGFCLGIVIQYQVVLLHIRKDLRATMKDLLRGERSPICLTCGYDLRSLVAQSCPECGSPVRQPH